MVIMKFGGTSVGSPENIEKVIDIVSKRCDSVACLIVSAYTKVTDQLIEMGQKAAKGHATYEEVFDELCARHVESVHALIHNTDRRNDTLIEVQKRLNELGQILQGVYLIKELSPKTLDLIMSFGERLSAYIISQAFNDRGIESPFIDARMLVKTNNNFGAARVDFKETNKHIVEQFDQLKGTVPLVTGFIGSTEKNETTTLGRGGSDYTASIFGAALNVKAVEIWTDVDGVMTANPRQVPTAFTFEKMSYQEAMEMSHFGAKVIHPPTMIPAMNKHIPIVIKNTFNPGAKGTIIGKDTSNGYGIKGISSITNIAVLMLQGSGMVGVPGVAARLFGALARNTINVILITQASSEHTICFAIDPKDVEEAQTAVEEEFKHEITDQIIEPLVVQNHLTILAVVGEHMRNTPGIAGKVFTALGNANISIVAIAQGSSERNISLVIEKKHEEKALAAIHKAFFGK